MLEDGKDYGEFKIEWLKTKEQKRQYLSKNVKMKKLGHRYLEKSITSGGNKRIVQSTWQVGGPARKPGWGEETRNRENRRWKSKKSVGASSTSLVWTLAFPH